MVGFGLKLNAVFRVH